MKVAGAIEPTGHGVHMPVHHIAGAIGLWIIKREQKGIGFGSEFVDGFDDRDC
jgi:hypothetical protein